MSVGAPDAALTPEQLALAATAPPPAFPDNDVDQALADNAAPVEPPQPKTAEEATAANAAEAQKIGAEKVKAAEKKAALDTQLATKKAEFQTGYNERLQQLRDQQELHRQEAEKHVSETRAKAETAQYHSLWDSRSTGQKLAIAGGLIIGGISWNPNHVNRGVQMLESAMKAEEENNRMKHADLWRAVDEAQQGVKDLDTSQLRELSLYNAREGAKWDRISGNLSALIAANKGRSDVGEAKKQALEASEKAATYWQNATHAAATASHLDQQDKERALHDREMEKARAKKAGGGGSGVGSAAQQKGAIEIREAIEKAKADGKPLTDSQIARLAFDKKIPEVAKAGRISLKTITDDIKNSANNKGLGLEVSDKTDNTVLRDPQTKEAYGRSGSAKSAAAFMKQDVQFGDAARRVQELADDIKQFGRKITNLDEAQRRAAKYANAIIGVAVVSPLGKTNEAIHQEAQSIGLSGAVDPAHLRESITQLLMNNGANYDTVSHKVEEMKRLRREYRNTAIPLSDEEKKKYNSVASNSDHPDRPIKGGGIAKWNSARGGYERAE